MQERAALIKKFVVDSFLFGSEDSFSVETSFLDEGIIDSTGILELVQFLEDTYAITIEDHELIPENLDSISKIVAYLELKAPVYVNA